MKLSGADILIKSLEAEGVDLIFGYPGGAVIAIYDRLLDCGIKHILTRHEQGAVHAADGYARVTGKPGVCIATSGPGATNLVTGIATAYMDSIPLVALTGQVGTGALGRDSFQEADITGITMPITKHNYLVKDVNELGKVIKEAFYIATTGRPGPVLIDIPKDVTGDIIDYEEPGSVQLLGYKPTYQGHPGQIKAAAKLIEKSKKPLLYVGGGVTSSNAHEELRTLVDKIKAPVTTTLLGIGAFPSDNELSLGMLGMHGTAYANYAMQTCDLIIAVGARFDDRVTGTLDTFAPNAKVIHIDIDPAEIGKNVKVTVPIVGNAKSVLKALTEIIRPGDYSDWLEYITQIKADNPLEYEKKPGEIKPQQVVEEISDLTNGEAIIVTEVGQNQMWAAQYYKSKNPRHFISSGGLGTMGYGFPAAIGAKFGCPDSLVFDIAGDGSIQMNIQELGTAVEHGLDVNIVILNNGCLGMVRQWQEYFFEKRYSHTTLCNNPDFVKVAEAYGGSGFSTADPSEVRSILQEAINIKDRPCVIDFKITPEENVIPMVAPGSPIDKMIKGGKPE